MPPASDSMCGGRLFVASVSCWPNGKPRGRNEPSARPTRPSTAAASKTFRDPITTEIVPLVKFWPAEVYHQDYFAKNPSAGYCRYVIAPKVKKLKEQIPALKK